MRRGDIEAARCTVERLMQSMDLCGVTRGKPVKTTVSDKAAPCPQAQGGRSLYARAVSAVMTVTSFRSLLRFCLARLMRPRAS